MNEVGGGSEESEEFHMREEEKGVFRKSKMAVCKCSIDMTWT